MSGNTITEEGAAERLLWERIPPALRADLAKFLLDRRTGNFRINIKDGEIMTHHRDEIFRHK